MNPLSVTCPDCGKRYRLPEGFARRTIRCRECQASIPVNADTDDEPDLPAAPKITRRKLPKRRDPAEPDDEDEEDDGRPVAKRRRSGSRSRNRPVSPFLIAAVVTLIYWALLGIIALMPGQWVWSLVGLLPNALVFLIWGMAGITLVVQEENETHAMICWSSFLLFLTPFVPCIAFVSLMGLVLILFYGLTKLEKTGPYVLMIFLAIGMLTVMGLVAAQNPNIPL